jgi:hypothetical protein
MSPKTILTIVNEEQAITLEYCGRKLLSIDKETLVDFTKEYTKDLKKDENTVRAIRLAKKYLKAKCKFYSKPSKVKYDSKHKDIRHFKKAIEIMDGLNIKENDYLQAQIDGLQFVQGGRGIFPKPNQLATEGAEDRAIQYLDSKGLIHHGNAELTDDKKGLMITSTDYKTPLKQNKQYMDLLKKLKEGTATMDEAIYLKNVRKARKGSAGPLITEYITKLK